MRSNQALPTGKHNIPINLPPPKNGGGDISNQNQLHEELVNSGRLTVQPLVELATAHLISGQMAAVASMQEAVNDTPYAEVAAWSARTDQESNEVGEELEHATIAEASKNATFYNEADLIASMIPELADELSKLTTKFEQQLLDQKKVELEARQAELQEQREAIDTFYEDHGKAWPVPQLVKLGHQVLQAPEKPEAVTIIDSFPAERAHLTNAEIAHNVRTRHGEHLQDASHLLALYLAEDPGRVFTLTEMADFLYDNSGQMYATRTSALISSFKLGKTSIIGEVLDGLGLQLQTGLRSSYYTGTGKRFGKTYTVLRAIDADAADQQKRVVQEHLSSDNETQYVDADWVDVSSTEEQARPLAAEEAQAIGAPAVKAVVEAPVRAKPAKANVTPKVPNWHAKVRGSVNAAIQQFVADDLMIEGNVSRAVVNVKSSSANMGTDTMMNRGYSHGILSRAQSIDRGMELPLHLYICLAIQNSHSALLSSSRKTSREVVAFVEQLVSEYFEEQAKSSN